MDDENRTNGSSDETVARPEERGAGVHEHAIHLQ
jgi:hypothetical protein